MASRVRAAAACQGSMAHGCTVPAEPRPTPQGSTAATWQWCAKESAPSPRAAHCSPVPHSSPARRFHPQPPPDQWAALAALCPPSVPRSCQEALATAPSGHVYLHEKNHRPRARRCLPAGTGCCPLCAASSGLAGCFAQPPPGYLLPCTGRGQSHFAGAIFSEAGGSDRSLAARTVQR